MKKQKVAVIGVGHLGRFHAEKYQQLPSTELIAVCDTHEHQCDAVAQALNTKAVYDFRYLLDQVNAVSIVTPTHTHYPIAKLCLEAGVHVLLEKPITQTVSQAEALIKIAAEQQVTLQIGHLERFNPAVTALERWIKAPTLIESIRTGPFQPRNLDVSVIVDLMIHDIEIIQALHPVPIQKIEATGIAMMSPYYDVANARLTFEDGVVAHLMANRVADQKQRQLRVYQHNAHLVADCQTQTLHIYQKVESNQFHATKEATQPTDTLAAQILDFISAIETKKNPRVGGEPAKKALETALAIEAAVTISEAAVGA